MRKSLQLTISVHHRLDDGRTPIDGSPYPAPPSLFNRDAIGNGAAQITIRQTGDNICEHVELEYMSVDDIVGYSTCCVANRCAVMPGDDDARFIQHCERVLSDTGRHGHAHVRAPSL
jgi:hypothetical protein